MPIINETTLSVTPTYSTAGPVKPEFLRTELLNWLTYIRDKIQSIDFILVKPIPRNYTQIVGQAPGYARFISLRSNILYSINEKYKFFSDMSMTNADYIIAQYNFLPGWIDGIETRDIPEMTTILENVNAWLQANYSLIDGMLQPVTAQTPAVTEPVQAQPDQEQPATVYTSGDEIINNAKDQAVKNPLLVVSIGLGLLKLFHVF